MPKRLAITGPYKVEVMEYDEPALEPKQVRVKTEIASGKHGTTTAGFDGSVFRGQAFDQTMRLFVDAPPPDPNASQEKKKPGNCGNIGVGVVTEVGSEVTLWKKGDRVFGGMDVRETNVCKEENLWLLGSIKPETALCQEPAVVSIHCIREGNVRYGDSVAVIGLGAIGLIAVEMARAAGANVVIGIDPLPHRREWAKKNGADEVFDPLDPATPAKVHKITNMKGVDVAIEASGAYPALNTALKCVRICGTVVSAGFYQGESKGLWLGREWHHNRLNIVVPHGCGWGHVPRDYPGWDSRRAQDVLVDMMRRGVFKANGVIDPIITIDKGQEVFTAMRDSPNKLLKFAVRF